VFFVFEWGYSQKAIFLKFILPFRMPKLHGNSQVPLKHQ
jgi:hypothetical protein